MNCDFYWYNTIIDEPILLPQYRIDKSGWVFEQFRYGNGYILELFAGYESEDRFYER